MSNTAMTAALACEVKPAAAKLLLLVLAFRQNEQTGLLNPGLACLMRDTGLSRTSVHEAMRVLKEAGLVSIVANAAGGSPFATAHYALHLRPGTSATGHTGTADRTRSAGRATSAAGCADGYGRQAGGVRSAAQTRAAERPQTRTNRKDNQKEQDARTRACDPYLEGLT